MSLAHLRKNIYRSMLFGLMAVALFGVLSTAQPALAANNDPLRIVRNDGVVFDIKASDLLFSESHVLSVSPESLVNADAGAKNFKPQGNYSAESVIGPDGRTQVTNTTTYPNTAIAQLEMAFPGGNYICSAWFIDANRLATAGHCVYDAAAGGWATGITVIPGRNGGTAPFGSFSATNWYATSGWVNTGKSKYDYAVIKLGSNVGNTVGWFGYGWTSVDSFFLNHKATVRGYPGDKTYGTMWTMSGKISQVKPTRLYYTIDTFGGQSGSPLYGKWNKNCNPCGFGIHTLGGTSKNSATRITKNVFNFFQSAGIP